MTIFISTLATSCAVVCIVSTAMFAVRVRDWRSEAPALLYLAVISAATGVGALGFLWVITYGGAP